MINKEIETLLNNTMSNVDSLIFPDVFTLEEKRINETELLGFSISTHPLKIFNKYQDKFSYIPVSTLLDENSCGKYLNEKITTIGIVKKIHKIITQGGDEMAFITLEHLGIAIS